ncbi:autotransporter assembly complex family protein [Neisseria leonii]|uniref:Translocation and assembly module subunit TamA n=1 Tax=Neisseria leonii TaxID=2995413 RepID=A0A9X4E4F4_9NEIS|nr:MULTISPECIES: autotransporter assembly complex family protein [unclassified Neisseria]MDD9325683.1 autotransporter assembly complex protein TamA [Neisseria sp. 3986]MDD9327826.1 autotransporter assembly complex protein TamA [Neisseria sp. 51.81]
MMKHKVMVWVLAALAGLPTAAWAQTEQTAGDAAPSVRPEIREPKYPVEIQTDNGQLKKMLEEHLPLITEQRQEDLDEEQIAFLAEQAPEHIKTMVRTKGYFSAASSVGRTGNRFAVRLDPGPQTKIDNVGVAIAGDVLQDENLGDYYRAAMDNWVLPVGEGFDQSLWNSSKSAVLSAVKRKKYPLAVLSHSQATINPNNHTADIAVSVDSRQPIYFGELDISGVKRYPERVVRGMARFEPGDPYDLDKLLDYQQSLEQDSHYSGASVQADFDNLTDNRVPVKVNVTEVMRQRLELGVRYDSEYGPGGRIGYDYYDLFGKGYVGSVVADADRYETSLSLGISQPRRSNGTYWTTSLGYKRSTVRSLQTGTVNSGIWYVRDRNGIESRLGVEYISENTRLPDMKLDLGNSYATMLTASWKRQNIETQQRPQNGYYLDGKIGSTVGSLLSSSAMQRITGRAGYYFTPEDKQLGTLVARGQFGYVRTGDKYQIPSTLLFRTGGATSVRGYELDSIGLAERFDGSVFPDRAMAVASIEYQYPVTRNFSAAVFHDTGAVSGSFKDLTFKHGTGLGVRWFSPVAPFSFDIAYGHNDKKIRWHISLGTRF